MRREVGRRYGRGGSIAKGVVGGEIQCQPRG